MIKGGGAGFDASRIVLSRCWIVFICALAFWICLGYTHALLSVGRFAGKFWEQKSIVLFGIMICRSGGLAFWNILGFGRRLKIPMAMIFNLLWNSKSISLSVKLVRGGDMWSSVLNNSASPTAGGKLIPPSGKSWGNGESSREGRPQRPSVIRHQMCNCNSSGR